jgi:methyl-accepting chemotaxis protein
MMGIADPFRVAVSGAGAAVARLDRILTAIEQLAVGIKTIEAEMRGLRADIGAVNANIDDLRASVDHLGSGVGGIRDATVSLDHKIDEVSGTLHTIDALARSIPGARRRARLHTSKPQVAPIDPA